MSHQITRCAYYEQLHDWNRIIEICDGVDAELVRRQYKAIRTALLCAKARALARSGEHSLADQAIATAVRVCPRGAVDPLIVLEASKAICLSARGELAGGTAHFDRSLAACRAIGHRCHEAWITRERADVTSGAGVAAPRHAFDTADTALLLSDATTILGAGHSIDILAHRVASILRDTPLGARTDVESTSGCEFQAEPSATSDLGTNGTFVFRLRGSDRQVVIGVRDVFAIDEISLLKSLADLIQAAMNRTVDTENEDDDQNLWPRTLVPQGEDTVFRSPRMVELLRIALRLATTDLPVLITGETGTGKEILARLVHESSRVRRGPFVPFNCAATPRELVESQLFGHRKGAFTGATDSFPGIIRAAERGTLFLDEIGDLDPAVQPKLLRFLERGEIHPVGELRPQQVPVRVIAATNADLTRLADEGQFRRDLFYRIGLAPIVLPPLRERKDEIPALASLFVSKFVREYDRAGLKLGNDFIAALLLYDWPGNIRELSNEIRRIVAMANDGDTLSSLDLSAEIVKRWNERPTTLPEAPGPAVQIRLDQSLAQAVSDLERHFIEHAMQATGGRVADAAQLLGLSRKGLFLKRRRRDMLSGATRNREREAASRRRS